MMAGAGAWRDAECNFRKWALCATRPKSAMGTLRDTSVVRPETFRTIWVAMCMSPVLLVSTGFSSGSAMMEYSVASAHARWQGRLAAKLLSQLGDWNAPPNPIQLPQKMHIVSWIFVRQRWRSARSTYDSVNEKPTGSCGISCAYKAIWIRFFNAGDSRCSSWSDVISFENFSSPESPCYPLVHPPTICVNIVS